MTGKVYLVGSGPGGLSLLTYRAREVIDKADVILYAHTGRGDVFILPPIILSVSGDVTQGNV